MDQEGYLPVTLIASFHRVQALTSDIGLILDAINSSDKLELIEFKVKSRKKYWFFLYFVILQVRSKRNPTKWPILDKSNESKNKLNKLVPPPPIPKKVRDHQNENLNPDVAEFVPQDFGKYSSNF